MKEKITIHFSNLYLDLKSFKKSLKVEKKYISKQSLRNEAERICKLWFDENKSTLNRFGVEKESISKYDGYFKELIKLASSHNLKSSYDKILTGIVSSFQDEIILPIKTSVTKSNIKIEKEYLLANIDNSQEGDYLQEAIDCFDSGFKKASIVLGWCATIDKIHKKIEKIGFDSFNKLTEKLASENKGRFKRFNKKYSISSIGELREVFDNDILWIIEGFGLIDSNQHTRLKSCFDMRNHSAHPGEAPITDYNVLSYFSDIIEIIIGNEEFQ